MFRPPFLLCAVFILNAAPPPSALAAARQYIRDYEYTASKYDSKHTCRLYAIDGVKRNLLEELGTYVESVVKINRGSMGESYMTHDLVTLTAGITRLKLLKEDWNSIRFYVKASMYADEDEVLRSVRELRKNHDLQDALRDSRDKLNKTRQEIKALKLALANGSTNIDLLKQYNQAAQSFESEMQFQEAIRHYIKGDFGQMLKIMHSLANEGNSKAQSRMGYMYERGIGVAKDYRKAAEWYIKAIQNGSKRAYARVGFLHARGLGVPQNYDEALKYLRKAVELESGLGYARLAYLYEIGKGVEQNYTRSVEYYKKAAEKGNGFGIARLGFMYQKGLGVDEDHDKAAELYKRAAHKGNPHGMARVGNMYLRGISVYKDHEKAYRYLLAAVERGNPFGFAKLGFMYEKGLHVDEDMNKAIELYRKGAEMKSTFAQFRMGHVYHKGMGVEKDRDEAINWYRLAANKGHAKAQRRLEKLLTR